MLSRTIALAIAASVIALRAASGADLPVVAAPAPVPTPVVTPVLAGPWTGFYFGGNLGYGLANANADWTLAGNALVGGTLTGSGANLDGVNGGFQGGYNWQRGFLLLGFEADIQAADQEATVTSFCGLSCSIEQKTKIDWFGTFRGRAGIAIKDVLFYGTGGLNWTHVDDKFTGTLNAVPATLADFDHNSFGWAAGAGIEWMFAWGWSAKFEYLHLENSNSKASITVPAILGGGIVTETASASNDVFRAGVNLHFPIGGWPYGGGWPYRW
jgi:outer membrane immunogenic protein